MLQSSLPTVVKDTGFTGRQPEHLPKLACRAVARSRQEYMRAVARLRFATARQPRSQLGFEQRLVAGVGVAPAEAELMRLA